MINIASRSAKLNPSAPKSGLARVSALAAFGLGAASLAISAAPAKAFQTTVDFSASPTVSNQTSRQFNGNFGVQATFSNAKARITGLAKTIDNNSNGICIAKSSITRTGPCGRSSLLPNTDGILSQGTIELVFNQQLNLDGFRVGQNDMDQIATNALNNPGALNFKLNGTQFATYAYSTISAGGTLYKFPSSIYYKPGDIITIENTGFSGVIPANRSFYLKSMDVGYTPAPLPVLATATAFGWSRRLRSRVRSAKAVVQ